MVRPLLPPQAAGEPGLRSCLTWAFAYDPISGCSSGAALRRALLGGSPKGPGWSAGGPTGYATFGPMDYDFRPTGAPHRPLGGEDPSAFTGWKTTLRARFRRLIGGRQPDSIGSSRKDMEWGVKSGVSCS